MPGPENCCSEDRQLDSDDHESSISSAPDGGYGWIIVAATFILNCIADGIAFSSGILFVEFKDLYDDTHGRTAFIGSLFTGIPMVLGPFCAVLIELFECRIVTVAGSLISAFGFILSIFAPSIDFLCFSLGVVGGLGFSLVYVPAIVIVSRYFDSKRALATGICASGSGVGTFVFPPLIQYLVDVYHVEGALLLLAGITLNCCACAALYRPIDSYWSTVDDTTSKPKLSADGTPAEVMPILSTPNDDDNQQRNQSADYYSYDKLNNLSALNISKTYENKRLSSDEIIRQTRKQRGDTIDMLIASKSQLGETVWKPSRPHRTLMRKYSRTRLCTVDRHTVVLHRQWRASQLVKVPECSNLPQPHRMNQNDRPLRFFVSCPELSINNQSNEAIPTAVIGTGETEEVAAESDVSDGRPCSTCRRWWRRLYTNRRTYFRLLFNKALWFNWKFILFFISNIILYAWYDVPYLYLPDFLLHIETDFEPAWVISILGVVNTVGQVIIGLLGDLPCINTVLLYLICITLTGLVNLLLIYFVHITGVIIYVCIFGFFVGANYSLCSVILVNLFGLENLTTAYGMTLFGQGVANSVFPPIGGYLRDYTASYNYTFVISGISIMFSGLMLLPIIFMKKPKVGQLEMNQA